ncbi:MAG: uroporphyrinogen-III synthase [Pseudonocardiaceae bacterium]|nr:uroporphyrinogen-III synthase [Pseudonocardiaceae bacterium]
MAMATATAALPLAGFTVGITAARRAEELGTLLQRRGAAVLHAPAIRIVPLPDDTELHEATRKLVATPPDVTVVTTGIGFRGWVEAADGWGLGEDLITALRATTLLARGPKSRGAIRAAGLADAWSPSSESAAEMLDHLLESGVDGLRVAIQLHGEPLPGMVDSLTAAGAHVVQVPVYRWEPPADLAPLDRLIEAALDRGVDAISFTSAPAAASLLARADALGAGDALVRSLHRDVLPVCVGPIAAGPLAARDVVTVRPQRARIGGLVRALAEELPARAPRWPVAGHDLELRGHAVLVDGELRPVPPGPMALLRLLAARPGQVASRTELLAAMSGGDDEHAVETAVARLRTALGDPRLVQTVMKRGYRLPLEPS